MLLAVVLGLAGGFAEFFLLRLTVNAMLGGSAVKGILAFLAKLAVLAAALFPVALTSPESLGVCGVCIALPLVVCSAAAFIKTNGENKRAAKTGSENAVKKIEEDKK